MFMLGKQEGRIYNSPKNTVREARLQKKKWDKFLQKKAKNNKGIVKFWK